MPLQAFSRWTKRIAARSGLSDRETEELNTLPITVENYEAQGEIVGAGEVTTRACIVASGLLGRTDILKGGQRQITAFYASGDMPDLHSVVLPRASTGLHAMTASVVLRVPHEAINRVSMVSPAIAIALWRECSIDAEIAHTWVTNVGQRQAVERLAHLFCEMAARDGAAREGNQFDFLFPVTQQQLSDATGMTVVHVNRVLRILRQRGMLAKSGGIVTVLDWNGLRGLADFNNEYLHLVN